MCLLGPSIQVGALKALDTQHGKAKVNQVFIICGRPVAKLEVVHIQLRCRERAAVKINTVQWSRGQHVTCWDSIEEPVRANTQLHIWRADDMRPLTVFQNKSSPPSSTHTHTRFWCLNCRILRRSWRVEPSVYIHEMPSWSCICWLAKTTFQFFLSSYKNTAVLQTHCTTQMKTYLDILSIRKTVCAVLLLQVKAWISTVKDKMLQWEGHVMLSYLAITSWFFFWLVNYL